MRLRCRLCGPLDLSSSASCLVGEQLYATKTKTDRLHIPLARRGWVATNSSCCTPDHYFDQGRSPSFSNASRHTNGPACLFVRSRCGCGFVSCRPCRCIKSVTHRVAHHGRSICPSLGLWRSRPALLGHDVDEFGCRHYAAHFTSARPHLVARSHRVWDCSVFEWPAVRRNIARSDHAAFFGVCGNQLAHQHHGMEPTRVGDCRLDLVDRTKGPTTSPTASKMVAKLAKRPGLEAWSHVRLHHQHVLHGKWISTRLSPHHRPRRFDRKRPDCTQLGATSCLVPSPLHCRPACYARMAVFLRRTRRVCKHHLTYLQ